MTQREQFRQLFVLYNGDKEQVIAAYAQAEQHGHVPRRSNMNGTSAIAYATALYRDAIKKGWHGGVDPAEREWMIDRLLGRMVGPRIPPQILHLVVHHRTDSRQPCANTWLDDNMLEAITTTAEIGEWCFDAMEMEARVRIHRRGWGNLAPTVCCEANVAAVQPIDEHTCRVSFDQWQILAVAPRLPPPPKRNFYTASRE